MSKKQAVIVIHGMGEQRPMGTVTGFAETVWLHDVRLAVRAKDGKKQIWSKPDARFGSHEMRRLTTNSIVATAPSGEPLTDGASVLTDFYEYYWQHLMKGNTWAHITGWIRPLMFRPPWRLPGSLRVLWALLWIVAVLAALLALDVALEGHPILDRMVAAQETLFGSAPLTIGILTVVAGALVAILGFLQARLIPVLGDAARYLDNAPHNVGARQAIREGALTLLKQVHDSDEYDRVILVGHSLGSVVAYDALNLLWSEYQTPEDGKRGAPQPIQDIESTMRTLREASGEAKSSLIDEYRERQRQLGEWLADPPGDAPPWKISDFVTMGSPLTHGELLLAKNPTDFAGRVAERALPTAPPVMEKVDGLWRISYGGPAWRLHHGAVFAATAWTNLYFPVRATFWGDVIGGPLAEVFGPAIVDKPVDCTIGGRFFLHTKYWTRGGEVAGTENHLHALRDALDLGRLAVPPEAEDSSPAPEAAP